MLGVNNGDSVFHDILIDPETGVGVHSMGMVEKFVQK